MMSQRLPSVGKSDVEAVVAAQLGSGALELLTELYRKQMVAANTPEAQAAADKEFSAGQESFALRPLK